jgi:hypothetical protein
MDRRRVGVRFRISAAIFMSGVGNADGALAADERERFVNGCIAG